MISENLGEFLTGNKIHNSPYVLNMLDHVYCRKVCLMHMDKLSAARLKLHIKNGYHNNWIIDNLPSAAIGMGKDGKTKKRYSGGFPLGFVDQNDAYIFNHVNIHVEYHPASDDKYLVVGFAVEPLSIRHEFMGGYQWDGVSKEGMNKKLATCPAANEHVSRDKIANAQPVQDSQPILYTYDVFWEESKTEWSTRWDIYLNEDHLVPAKIHWYSITNSILVVLFLSLLVISILVRNLKRDIAAYNALAALADDEKDEEMDETGWKLVHADVFRPPQTMPMIFCVFCGSGSQLALTALFAIVFSAIGFLSPHGVDHSLTSSSWFTCCWDLWPDTLAAASTRPSVDVSGSFALF